MKVKRRLGEAYALYRLRVGRGTAYTSEVQGLLDALQKGGVIILIVHSYFHVLPPLWLLPIFWLTQKIFEFGMGLLDEKYLHWWQFENNYQSEHLNPWNKELMDAVRRIEKKLE